MREIGYLRALENHQTAEYSKWQQYQRAKPLWQAALMEGLAYFYKRGTWFRSHHLAAWLREHHPELPGLDMPKRQHHDGPVSIKTNSDLRVVGYLRSWKFLPYLERDQGAGKRRMWIRVVREPKP